MNNAKAYDKKTAAFAGWLIQNVPEDITDDDMNRWMDDPDGTKKVLAGLKPSEPNQTKAVPPLFSIVATFPLEKVAGKKTKKCFVGPLWNKHGRDGAFDSWLAADQPEADACVISTLAPQRGWTFVEAAAFVLGVSKDTSVAELGKMLKERGYTMTPAQAEEMVEATERKLKTGMRTDGYGNFFFVENADGSVSVGCVYRDDRDWRAYVYPLGNARRWLADDRLLLCNLDAGNRAFSRN